MTNHSPPWWQPTSVADLPEDKPFATLITIHLPPWWQTTPHPDDKPPVADLPEDKLLTALIIIHSPPWWQTTWHPDDKPLIPRWQITHHPDDKPLITLMTNNLPPWWHSTFMWLITLLADLWSRWKASVQWTQPATACHRLMQSTLIILWVSESGDYTW